MFQPSTPEAVHAELQARRDQIRSGFARRFRAARTTPSGVTTLPRPRSHPPTPLVTHSRVRAV